MNAAKIKQPPYSTVGKFWKSLLVCLPMFLLLFIFLSGGRPDFSDYKSAIAFLIVFLGFNYLFFRIIYTGKTDKYRAVGFIAYAVFLSFVFLLNMFEANRGMTFDEADLLQCEIPFCHLVISMVLIPAALTNKINAFDIRIDKEKCTECDKCIKECPTLSLDESSYKTGKAHFTCCKCGKCIDVCPTHAIHYHIKGTPVNKSHTTSRNLYIFGGFLFLAVFSGGTFQMGIYKIMNLVTTGSF